MIGYLAVVFLYIGIPFLLVYSLVPILRKKATIQKPGVTIKFQNPKLFASDHWITSKLGAGQGAIIVLLMFSLLAICERILYDLSRTIGGPNYDYFDNLRTIMVHTIFIVPILAAFIIINIIVGQRRQKYALVLMPYLVTSIVLTLQLILEISVYFSNHHTEFQLDVVLFCIVCITSYAIWYIQGLYEKRLKEMKL